MTAQGEPQGLAAEPQTFDDDVAASIFAIEQAVLKPSPRGDRAAIHKLGCRIVAQALAKNEHSG